MTQWGLDTLFNPAKRHMDEEKRRLQSTREELGDSSGGKRIDLESGKVVIARPTAEDEPADNADDEPASAAKGEHAPAPKPKTAPARAVADKPQPSPAQVRAAQRRGRQPR